MNPLNIDIVDTCEQRVAVYADGIKVFEGIYLTQRQFLDILNNHRDRAIGTMSRYFTTHTYLERDDSWSFPENFSDIPIQYVKVQ